MSNYVITKYSYDRAKKVGLVIKQSKNPLKKSTFIKIVLEIRCIWITRTT